MRAAPSNPFARKPIATLLAEMHGGERLHRVLGPLALTSLGVGATIGTGIYVLTGEVAHNYAGPSLMLSFLLAGVGCGFAALCYSELASMVPVAGSAYTYAYATLGELIAWIIGWDLILEYAIGSAAVANGWSNYFVALLAERASTSSSTRGCSHPRGTTTISQGEFLLKTVTLASGATGHGLVQPARGRHHGVHHGDPGHRHPRERGFNAAMVMLNIGVILTIVGVGAAYVDPAQLAAVPPRGEGLARGGRGGRADLLRLHRLRLDLDPRRGGPEPPARPGDRHHRLADRSARSCTSRSRPC